MKTNRPGLVIFRRSSLCLLGVFLVAATAALQPTLRAGESPRGLRSLDDDWRFHLGAAPEATATNYDDSTWRRVDVPHDYVIEGSFDPESRFSQPRIRGEDWHWLHGFLSVQPAVYRKTYDIPADAKGRRLWLEFDGVFNNSRYWLNGKEIGQQYSGYTRSRFDITDTAICGGRNVLVVEVDPRFQGWWYEGGGIYRHVRLISVDPVHIAPDGVFVVSTVNDPGDGEKTDAVVTANTDVTNTSASSVSATVLSEILDASGQVVATATSVYEVGVSSSVKVTQPIPLAHAALWSTEKPQLYRLRSTVRVDDRVVDRVTTTFGVRHIRLDAARGLFVNGRHVELKGVNIHQDHAGVGVAVPDRLFTWRLERLKEMGCNAIRLAHNPVEPFLLDECDRLGFLVMAENRNMGDVYIDQTLKDAPAVKHRELTELVRRDRNHPSIFCWSLCNEQWIAGSPEAGAMVRAMRQRVLELDPTRPVGAALNGGFDSPAGIIGHLDVIGINYNPSVYDSVHALLPQVPMVGTEIASEIGTRGVYTTDRWQDNGGVFYGDRDRGYVSAYSLNSTGQTVEEAWPPVMARDNIAGGFVWAGFDYKGEPRPFGWPVVNCHYGFMDLCGYPKDSYYYYKAWWMDEPVLHVFPHWNWSGREGQEIPVWVHSNCDEVELFLNGVSLGKQKVTPLHHLEWKVKYAPGKLVAKGVRKGVALESVRETTGQPAAIRLSADRSDLTADNSDLAVVKVEVVDAQGRVVPTAGNKITFALTGPAKLIGVGNGDPSCHEPDKANSRSAFNGLAQAIVQTTTAGGEITLRAASPDLKAGVLTLRSQ